MTAFVRTSVVLLVAAAAVAFLYEVQGAPVPTTNGTDLDVLEDVGQVRVKRNGGCGCCGCCGGCGGCGCCGCGGGGGGGCGCCCCRPCCRCTCCRTCCCTRCCTCCRPCCCGCCGCCGCGGGGRKRRSLQKLAAKLFTKRQTEMTSAETSWIDSPEAQPVGQPSDYTKPAEKVGTVKQTSIGAVVNAPESPNAYGYY